MKIRIKGNSLRYRLTKSDVAALTKDGHLQEQTNFIGQSLVYALTVSNSSSLSAEYVNNIITLFVPQLMLAELVDTDKVGFAGSSGDLQLLVEKDFTCLDNVDEDQSDNYPNPLALQKD